MGHAGAHVHPSEGDALGKIKALEDAGVFMVNHPSNFGDGMKLLLEQKSSPGPFVSTKKWLLNSS